MVMTMPIERKLVFKAGAITIIRAQNKSGYEVTAGDVVVLSTADSSATNISFTTSNTSDDIDVIGMAIQTIAKDEYGEIQTIGPTALLRVGGIGDISIGDELAVVDSGAYADYTAGNCNLSAGGTALTGGGSSPTWTDVMVGAKIRFASETTMYLITAYGSATALTISPAYRGSSDLTDESYVITYKGRAMKATAGKGGAFATAFEGYTTDDGNGTLNVVLFPPSRVDSSASGAVTYGNAGEMDNDGLQSANAAGGTDKTARIDHVHTATADTPALTLGTSNSAGTAGSILAADASIAMFDSTAATSIEPDDGAASGSAAIAARRDHTHGVVGAAPADGSFDGSNSEGSASSFSRSDHAHKAILLDDVDFYFGTGSEIVIGMDTTDTGGSTAEDLVIGLSNAKQTMHITDKDAAGTNWGINPDPTDPELHIHSNTTPATNFLRLGKHTGTVATIDVVGGTTLNLDIAGTTEVLLTGSILDLTSVNLQMQDSSEILDNGGLQLITFPAAVGSAQNNFQISNAGSGNPPILEAIGSTNADIDISILCKGTGVVTFDNGTDPVVMKLMGAAGSFTNEIQDLNGLEILALQGVTSAVTELTITNAATGVGGPTLGVQGETNTNLKLTPNGTGAVNIAPGTAGTVTSPSLIFDGAAAGLDTGFFADTADELGVTVGGVQAMYFGAGGEVIIGTTTVSTFAGTGKSLIFDEIAAITGNATNQAAIYAYDSAAVTILAQRKSDGSSADL